ncbi:MAG: hypothetical protein QM741_10235 [Rudaea sp.]|uniref:hypothetical protein n=1 Tax=Rudaea sp. TaxID=2136325 RepID=UPI0039E37E9B
MAHPADFTRRAGSRRDRHQRAAATYNPQGLRSGITGAVATSYGYDAIGRLSSLAHDLSGTAQDVNWSLGGYDAASEVKSQTLSANAYAWTDQRQQRRVLRL